VRRSKPVIRPATADDLARFRPGETWPTVKATVGEVDGAPVAIGGLAFVGGRVIAFLEMDDGARPYKLSLFREMTRIMNEAKASGLRLIYATPDPNEPTAEALLTRLGFSRDHKGAWRWQAFQRLSA